MRVHRNNRFREHASVRPVHNPPQVTRCVTRSSAEREQCLYATESVPSHFERGVDGCPQAPNVRAYVGDSVTRLADITRYVGDRVSYPADRVPNRTEC